MKFISFFAFLLLFNPCFYGQSISDTVYLKTIFEPVNETADYKEYFDSSDSDLHLLISFSFIFYKSYISSQDVDACVFHPSCSVYTIESVKKKGVINGLLNGFDRLLRCNAFVSDYDYEYNRYTKKYNDAP